MSRYLDHSAVKERESERKRDEDEDEDEDEALLITMSYDIVIDYHSSIQRDGHVGAVTYVVYRRNGKELCRGGCKTQFGQPSVPLDVEEHNIHIAVCLLWQCLDAGYKKVLLRNDEAQLIRLLNCLASGAGAMYESLKSHQQYLQNINQLFDSFEYLSFQVTEETLNSSTIFRLASTGNGCKMFYGSAWWTFLENFYGDVYLYSEILTKLSEVPEEQQKLPPTFPPMFKASLSSSSGPIKSHVQIFTDLFNHVYASREVDDRVRHFLGVPLLFDLRYAQTRYLQTKASIVMLDMCAIQADMMYFAKQWLKTETTLYDGKETIIALFRSLGDWYHIYTEALATRSSMPDTHPNFESALSGGHSFYGLDSIFQKISDMLSEIDKRLVKCEEQINQYRIPECRYDVYGRSRVKHIVTKKAELVYHPNCRKRAGNEAGYQAYVASLPKSQRQGPGQGLYCGPQWNEYVLCPKHIHLMNAINYLNSLKPAKLKLPPAVYPSNSLYGLEGYPLHSNPPDSQARYLLAKAEITELERMKQLVILDHMNNRWQSAAETWQMMNDRLYYLRKKVGGWPVIYQKAMGRGLALDSVLEDGHHLSVLNDLLPKLELLIETMDEGRMRAAQELGQYVGTKTGTTEGSSKGRRDMWELIENPKEEYYGKYWFDYIVCVDDLGLLEQIIMLFQNLDDADHPPTFPPPIQCPCCTDHKAMLRYFHLQAAKDESIYEGFEGSPLEGEAVQYQIRYIVAMCELTSIALLCRQMLQTGKRSEFISALQCKMSAEALLEKFKKKYKDWAVLCKNAEKSKNMVMLFMENNHHYYSLIDIVHMVTLIEDIFQIKGGSAPFGEGEKDAVDKASSTSKSVVGVGVSDANRKSKSGTGFAQGFLSAKKKEPTDGKSKQPDAGSKAGYETVSKVTEKIKRMSTKDLASKSSDSAHTDVDTSSLLSGRGSGSASFDSHDQQSSKTASSTHMLEPHMTSLLRQYECSICLEPMAYAISLHPCGDTFCYMCISDYLSTAKEKKCPCCQSSATDLSMALRNRLAEHSVREIMEQLGEEGKEQLKSWEGRVKAGLEAWKEVQAGKTESSAGKAEKSKSCKQKK